ncbi:MAG: DUF1697 domain-containing protein, partial [Anaerolineae bacterium]
MADTLIALIRGINVGRANRVAMAELRALVEALGYTHVRTLLNSGNVVLVAACATPSEAADRIEGALGARLGVSARITALTAAELDRPDVVVASAVRAEQHGGAVGRPCRLAVIMRAGRQRPPVFTLGVR